MRVGVNIPFYVLAMLVFVAVLALPCTAQAAESAGTLDVACSSDGARWSQSDTVQLAFPGAKPVEVSCTPASIEVGISCGMEEMCGLDPCLCGASDAFGCCACNGFEQRSPEVSISSEDILRAWPVHVGKRWYVVSLLPGQTQLHVTGELDHYDGYAADYRVKSATVSFAGVLVLISLVAIVVGVVVLVVRAISGRAGRGSQDE